MHINADVRLLYGMHVSIEALSVMMMMITTQSASAAIVSGATMQILAKILGQALS
jgi:hypothetical protein